MNPVINLISPSSKFKGSKNISPLVKLAWKSIEGILYLILLLLLNRLATCLVGQDFCIMWWLLKEPFFKVEVDLSLRFFLGLLGQKHSLDVRKNTSLCNGDTSQQFVQLFVITHSQLKVTGNDSCLLVVTSSIARQLKNLSAQIFKYSSQVHWSTSTNSLSVIAFAEKTVDSTYRELKPCSWWAALGLGALSFTFTATRHVSYDMISPKMMGLHIILSFMVRLLCKMDRKAPINLKHVVVFKIS